MCEGWDHVLVNCCISVIWKLNTGLGKSKWWLHPQNDSRKKNICTFSPLSRGLERSSSLKTFLYSFDSKSCTAETVSSHTLLIPQLLLSGAHAANIVFPRNHSVHWLYFVDSRLPLFRTPAKVQATSFQWDWKSWTVKLPKPGLVESLQSLSPAAPM